MVEIDTLFQTETAKNHTLWHCTYLYSLYKGVPPPLRGEERVAGYKCRCLRKRDKKGLEDKGN